MLESTLKQLWRALPRPPVRACAHCGQQYQPVHSQQAHCGVNCLRLERSLR